jgi:hypothetical protein
MIDAGTTVAPAPARGAHEYRQLERWRRRPGQLLGSSVQQRPYVSPAFPGSGVADAHVACGSSEPHHFSSSLNQSSTDCSTTYSNQMSLSQALVMLLFMHIQSPVAFETDSNAHRGLSHRPLSLVHFLERDICFLLFSITQLDHLSFSPTNETKAPCTTPTSSDC